jgi:hypothetical protein
MPVYSESVMYERSTKLEPKNKKVLEHVVKMDRRRMLEEEPHLQS